MFDTSDVLIKQLTECDHDSLKTWVEHFLASINYIGCQWFPTSPNDELYATSNDSQHDCEILVTIRQYSILTVGIEELSRFADTLREKMLTQGMFITTSTFSKEAIIYANTLRDNYNIRISLIDGKVMARYLGQTDLLSPTCKNERIPIERCQATSPIPRLREQKKLLRVTFPDGTMYCDKSASQTFLQTINHIGADKVSRLGLEVCHIPLVSKSVNEQYKEWIKPIDNGWYVMTQGDTEQKFRLLFSINKQLSVNMILEYGPDFVTISETKSKHKTKCKSQLMVTFPNGKIIAGRTPTDTFVDFIKHIGVENVMMKNISLANKQLFTPTNKYNGQINIGENKWLTIPNTTKNKYKIMKVIGSMTHTNFDIAII